MKFQHYLTNSIACDNEREIVSDLRLCVLNAAPSETADGDLRLITELSLLTRCAWLLHAIYRAALLMTNSYMFYKVANSYDLTCDWEV